MIQTIISQRYEGLSQKGKRVANEILILGDMLPFTTVRQLSARTSVSTLTVVRTVRELGFTGYRDFQNYIQKEYLSKKDSYDAKNENKFCEKNINEAAKLISNARKVYVTGARSAYSFAHYTVYMARMVFDKFHLILPSGANSAEDLAMISNDDVIIAFSSQPYSSETVRFLKAARQLKIKTIAITDTPHSPLAKSANVAITLSIKKGEYLYKMGPVLSVIEKLLESCFKKPDSKANEQIKFFAERINSVSGYWK